MNVAAVMVAAHKQYVADALALLAAGDENGAAVQLAEATAFRLRAAQMHGPDVLLAMLDAIEDDTVRAVLAAAVEADMRRMLRAAIVAGAGIEAIGRYAWGITQAQHARKRRPSGTRRKPARQRPAKRAAALARRDAAQAPPAYAVPRALSRGIAPRVIAERPTRRSLAPMA